jgi:hypothetical protein
MLIPNNEPYSQSKVVWYLVTTETKHISDITGKRLLHGREIAAWLVGRLYSMAAYLLELV